MRRILSLNSVGVKVLFLYKLLYIKFLGTGHFKLLKKFLVGIFLNLIFFLVYSKWRHFLSCVFIKIMWFWYIIFYIMVFLICPVHKTKNKKFNFRVSWYKNLKSDFQSDFSFRHFNIWTCQSYLKDLAIIIFIFLSSGYKYHGMAHLLAINKS